MYEMPVQVSTKPYQENKRNPSIRMTCISDLFCYSFENKIDVEHTSLILSPMTKLKLFALCPFFYPYYLFLFLFES